MLSLLLALAILVLGLRLRGFGWGGGGRGNGLGEFGRLCRRRLRRLLTFSRSVVICVRVRPLGGCRFVGPSIFVKLAIGLQLLFSETLSFRV